MRSIVVTVSLASTKYGKEVITRPTLGIFLGELMGNSPNQATPLASLSWAEPSDNVRRSSTGCQI
jgi:hypothetical protein